MAVLEAFTVFYEHRVELIKPFSAGIEDRHIASVLSMRTGISQTRGDLAHFHVSDCRRRSTVHLH